MKTFGRILSALVLLCGAMTMNAQGMSVMAVRNNARFLTDRMAYTLGVTDPFLIDEMYRINYDYIWGVNDYLDDVAMGYYYSDYILVCEARDAALRNLLGYTLWNRLLGFNYYHRPIVFTNRTWHFGIYDHDRYGVHHYHYSAPRYYGSGYAGGHFFRGMAPRGGRVLGSGVRNGHPVGGHNMHGNDIRDGRHGGMNNGSNHSGMRFEGNHSNNHFDGNRSGNRSGNVVTPSAPAGRSDNNARSSSRSGSTVSSSRTSSAATPSSSASRSRTSSATTQGSNASTGSRSGGRR